MSEEIAIPDSSTSDITHPRIPPLLKDADREFLQKHTEKHPFFDDDTNDTIIYFEDQPKDSKNMKAVKAATWFKTLEKCTHQNFDGKYILPHHEYSLLVFIHPALR